MAVFVHVPHAGETALTKRLPRGVSAVPTTENPVFLGMPQPTNRTADNASELRQAMHPRSVRKVRRTEGAIMSEFVQVIECRTHQFDEIDRLEQDWLAADRGQVHVAAADHLA